MLAALLAAFGTLLTIQTLVSLQGWIGLQLPFLRRRKTPGVVFLGAGILWGAALVFGGWVVIPGALLGTIASIALAVLSPIDPDSRFLPEGEALTSAGVSFRKHALDVAGDPDAGALLLEPSYNARPCAVILCHGGGNDRLCGLWLMADVLLSRGFTVVTAHLAGHGAGGTDRFSIESCRRRIDALVGLVRARGKGSVVLLGQSMGGAFTLDFLARGGGVDAAVSVSAPVSLHPAMNFLMELGTFIRALAALRFGTPDKLLPAYGSFRRDVYPIRLQDGAADYVREFRDTLDSLALTQRLRQQSIRVPLLVVHGERDGIVPVAQAAQIREAAGAGSELVTFDELHHLDVLLDPPSVERIIDWVEQRAVTVTPRAA